MTAAAGIPEAWPLLLSREQLRAYLGGMSEPTLARVCPVPPVSLGASLIRYNRHHIDQWVATLPPRLLRLVASEQDAVADPEPLPDIPESRAQSAVDRARARAAKEASRCQKAS